MITLTTPLTAGVTYAQNLAALTRLGWRASALVAGTDQMSHGLTPESAAKTTLVGVGVGDEATILLYGPDGHGPWDAVVALWVSRTGSGQPLAWKVMTRHNVHSQWVDLVVPETVNV